MYKWMKRLFIKEKQYFYGIDWGNADKSTFMKAYKDKNGKIHIVEMKEI